MSCTGALRPVLGLESWRRSNRAVAEQSAHRALQMHCLAGPNRNRGTGQPKHAVAGPVWGGALACGARPGPPRVRNAFLLLSVHRCASEVEVRGPYLEEWAYQFQTFRGPFAAEGRMGHNL